MAEEPKGLDDLERRHPSLKARVAELRSRDGGGIERGRSITWAWANEARTAAAQALTEEGGK